MEIRLLGPVELVSERDRVPIPSAKQRALLAFVALQPGRLVTTESLVGGLWGDDPPDGGVTALRFHVSRLRGILRDAGADEALQTRPGGYVLAVDPDAVDAVRFERMIAGARSARSEGAAPDEVSRALRAALDVWAGSALADVNGAPFVVGERRRLEELRLAVVEEYLTAELAAGRHAEAVGELERLVDLHPRRERLWELLITALYRSGRQADALAAYQRVRRTFADQLGIEPSAALRELDRKVLLQDAGLAVPAPPPVPGAVLAADPTEEPRAAVAGSGPPAGEATARRSSGLATGALALGVVALGLVWFGLAAAAVALLAIVCGTVAVGRASWPGAPAARRGTAAIVVGAVALVAGAGAVLYRDLTDHGTTLAITSTAFDEGGRAPEPSVAPSTTETRATPTTPTTAAPAADSDDAARPEGARVYIDRLVVGDCFDPPPGTGDDEVPDYVYVLPCDVPHDLEVFHLFELDAGPYPGDAQVDALAWDECHAAFEAYVGIAYERSELGVIYVYPAQEIWEVGDRGGGCSLVDPLDRDLTGSMRDSRR